ncbi:Heme oxygenase [Kaistella treverensis]|uniref:Heme oxygenase n=1 Tax=Kaistella treverensis TaxID=631455 RepID=A0A1I3N3J8_9FLAO|nr:biliverdin-producing heme oxygenase [Kaistella treverensis]SFJ03853.1 Heme oxygenase [Kaistella treverensis]
MISEKLKYGTRHLHDLTEEKFNSTKIFEGTFDLNDYRKLLFYNYEMLNSFENEVFNFIPAKAADFLNLESRRKVKLAETDMMELGVPLPPERNLASVKNLAEAFGIFYVMEGSTLGGNMIAKHLSKSGEFADAPFHYFKCYGPHTGSYWKTFKEVLDREIKPEDEDACLRGAEKAYSFLLNLRD